MHSPILDVIFRLPDALMVQLNRVRDESAEHEDSSLLEVEPKGSVWARSTVDQRVRSTLDSLGPASHGV